MSLFPSVKVKCKVDDREKEYFFGFDKNGILTPNACEDANASEVCRDCMKTAIDLLIKKYQ